MVSMFSPRGHRLIRFVVVVATIQTIVLVMESIMSDAEKFAAVDLPPNYYFLFSEPKYNPFGKGFTQDVSLMKRNKWWFDATVFKSYFWCDSPYDGADKVIWAINRYLDGNIGVPST